MSRRRSYSPLHLRSKYYHKLPFEDADELINRGAVGIIDDKGRYVDIRNYKFCRKVVRFKKPSRDGRENSHPPTDPPSGTPGKPRRSQRCPTPWGETKRRGEMKACSWNERLLNFENRNPTKRGLRNKDTKVERRNRQNEKRRICRAENRQKKRPPYQALGQIGMEKSFYWSQEAQEAKDEKTENEEDLNAVLINIEKKKKKDVKVLKYGKNFIFENCDFSPNNRSSTNRLCEEFIN